MRSVDTNVLVRLLTRDDPRQTEAAERFVAVGAWVSHLVLVETSWVLRSVYDRSSRQVAEAIDKLLDHQHVVVQDADVVRSAVEILRQRPSIGFSDCLLVEIARKAGHLPVGTFDRDLAGVDGAERIA
jgi:predicted nucleic-acid-binding protein